MIKRSVVSLLLLFVALFAPPDAPAIPNLDNCTAVSIGYNVAEHSLNLCMTETVAGEDPFIRCMPEIEVVAMYMDLVDFWCDFDMP